MLTGKTQLKVIATPVGTASQPVSGDLSFIDNAADPATGTIRLRARFDNRDRVMWPGQFVNVALHLPTVGPSLVIPDAAVGQNAQGNFVFVVRQNGTAEQRAIKVLRTADDMAVVTGVQPGETIVVDGQSRLSPDAKVRVQTGKEAA